MSEAASIVLGVGKNNTTINPPPLPRDPRREVITTSDRKIIPPAYEAQPFFMRTLKFLIGFFTFRKAVPPDTSQSLNIDNAEIETMTKTPDVPPPDGDGKK